MSFIVPGCVLLVMLLLGIAIDSLDTEEQREKRRKFR